MRRALQLAGGAALRFASARASLAPASARSFSEKASDGAAGTAVSDVAAAAAEVTEGPQRKQYRSRAGSAVVEGAVLRLRNVPRYALRHELAAMLISAGTPVSPEQLQMSYDLRLRPDHWFVQLPPTPPPTAVLDVLRSKKLRLGARVVSADLVAEVPEMPQELNGALGRACVVSHLPIGITGSHVVTHFSTYRLARDVPGGPRPVTMLDFPPRKDEGSTAWPAALVRFESELDALIAARDMHRALIGGVQIEVRHVQ